VSREAVRRPAHARLPPFIALILSPSPCHYYIPFLHPTPLSNVPPSSHLFYACPFLSTAFQTKKAKHAPSNAKAPDDNHDGPQHNRPARRLRDTRPHHLEVLPAPLPRTEADREKPPRREAEEEESAKKKGRDARGKLPSLVAHQLRPRCLIRLACVFLLCPARVHLL
jgi:hypothetical protein